MIKRILLSLLAVLLLLAVAVVANTLRQESRQLAVPPAPPLALDVPSVAGKLAGAIRFKTVASFDGPQLNADEFRRFHADLEQRFPRAHAVLKGTIRSLFPGTVVAPSLMIGGTDSRHFSAISDNIYRFSPVRARAEDLPRFHGTNERIATSNLAELVRFCFYHQLLRNAATAPSP